MSIFRIGVPSKGRLAELAADLLKEAGLSFRRSDRSLFARCRDIPIDVTFLRTEDIPVLCAEGAIDMGISGSDLITFALVSVVLLATAAIAVLVPAFRAARVQPTTALRYE